MRPQRGQNFLLLSWILLTVTRMEAIKPSVSRDTRGSGFLKNFVIKQVIQNNFWCKRIALKEKLSISLCMFFCIQLGLRVWYCLDYLDTQPDQFLNGIDHLSKIVSQKNWKKTLGQNSHKQKWSNGEKLTLVRYRFYNLCLCPGSPDIKLQASDTSQKLLPARPASATQAPWCSNSGH